VAGTTGSYDIAILRDLAEAQRSHRRVRVVLRNAAEADATVRVVEGFAIEIVHGADGKVRVRMGVPVGSGEPIEVRLELSTIAVVQFVS
jgi:hypothetical protein